MSQHVELPLMNTPSYLVAARRPFPWRVVVLAVLLLALLACGVLLVRRALYEREVAAERAQTNQYGVHALMGPFRPGGPLFGDGDLADLVVTDNGWNTAQNSDGTKVHTIFVTVHNKSERTWHNVQVVADLSDDGGEVGTQRADVGALGPGQDGTANFPDMGGRVNQFQVTGVDGQ